MNLLFKKDWNVDLIKEMFEMLRWKRTLFIILCRDELSNDNIPEEECSQFQEQYYKNLVKMNDFLENAVGWIQHQITCQPQEKNIFSSTTKKCQSSYEKIKLLNKKCETECSRRTNKLKLNNRDRKLQEEIELAELKFQQKGKELELVEKNLLCLNLKDNEDKKSIRKKAALGITHAGFGWVVNNTITCRNDKLKKHLFVSKEDLRSIKGKIDCLYKINVASYNSIKTTLSIHGKIHRVTSYTFRILSLTSAAVLKETFCKNSSKSMKAIQETFQNNLRVDGSHVFAAAKGRGKNTFAKSKKYCFR